MRVVFELCTPGASLPPQHAGASRRIGIPGQLSAADAIGLSLGSTDERATLVIRVSEHQTVSGAQASEYDEALDRGKLLAEQAIEGALAEGARAQERGDLARAAECFRYAARLLATDEGPRLVLVIVSLAEIDRAQGQLERARQYLDHALSIAPTHLGALRARASLARELSEPALAAALLARLAPELETSAKRVETLMQVADDSLLVARDSIEFASDLIPGSVQLLHRLCAVNEAMGNYEAALSAAVRQAEFITDPHQRARAMVDAARLCSEHVHHTPRAVALYEAAIEDDPEVPGAFEAIEKELLQAHDFDSAAHAYKRQLERLEASQSTTSRRALLRKLGQLQREELGQPQAAVSTLQQLVELAPDDLTARVDLATLLLETGETAKATRALETAAWLAPTRAETYRSLSTLLRTAKDQDRLYSTCSVLVALGEAELDEQMIHAQFRPEALPSPRSNVDDDTFTQLLPDEHPDAFDRFAEALEPAAFEVWLDPASQNITQLPSPKSRVDPGSSTISAVRCFHWAARVLNIRDPEIYVDPKITRFGAHLLPQLEPAILLGRPILGGRPVGELAFLAAHHFTYTRPGWRLASLCGSYDEVSALVLAGAALARPDLPDLATPRSRAAELAERLEPYVDSRARSALAELAGSLLDSSGSIDVGPWLRSIESTACRAGLLACGDVAVAGTVLAVAGTAPSGQSAAERARSLLPFCSSQRHSALRHWLGIAVPSST